MKIELSREEKFFQDIIFTNNLIKKQIFTELDYNKLVMLSSSHLMLPSLYYNLKIKKYLHLIPEDLKKYLKNIYNLNRERNSILLSEAFELAGILNKHNIKFRFIKGAFYLIENIYENKDERMIGDIDFLINKIDIDKTKKLLVKSNYRSEFDLIKWETKHLPRFLNPKKIFAIEPHSHILRTLNNKYLSTEKILSKSNTDKFGFLLDICIMNYQVNDYGLLKKHLVIK